MAQRRAPRPRAPEPALGGLPSRAGALPAFPRLERWCPAASLPEPARPSHRPRESRGPSPTCACLHPSRAPLWHTWPLRRTFRKNKPQAWPSQAARVRTGLFSGLVSEVGSVPLRRPGRRHALCVGSSGAPRRLRPHTPGSVPLCAYSDVRKTKSTRVGEQVGNHFAFLKLTYFY